VGRGTKVSKNSACIHLGLNNNILYFLEFSEELSSRPFCMCINFNFSNDRDVEQCAACHRSSQTCNFKMYLFGRRYNASRFWTNSRWDKEVPDDFFFHSRDDRVTQKCHNLTRNYNPEKVCLKLKPEIVTLGGGRGGGL
jgi:Domain of unknown function (DUF4211)